MKGYKKVVLKSGLRVLMLQKPDSLASTVLVLVEAGSEYEKKENAFNDAILADIEARFQRSTANIDEAFSERALNFARNYDKLDQASYNFFQALRSGKPPNFIDEANQTLIKALNTYYEVTERDNEREKKDQKKDEPPEGNEEQEKAPRHVMFGDIGVIEELVDTLSPEELQQYQENLVLFKKLVESAQDPAEKTFLSSQLVFRSIMGLEPESSFLGNEGKVIFRALERVGGKDKFAVMVGGKFSSDIVFVHAQAAESVLRQYSNELGIQLPQDRLSREQVAKYVKALYNQPDVKKANYAIGLLSGFPKDAVDYFVTHTTHFGEYPLRSLDLTAIQYLASNGPTNLDHERVRNVYTRDYLQYGDAKQLKSGTNIAVRGFGTDFVALHPPSKEVIQYCQRLLEIDRRLGITQYIKKVRSKL